MMDEYITRNNAISAVCFGCNQEFSDEPCEPCECSIRQSIMALPAADVVPRAELDAMRGAANSYKMHYEKAKQEADRLAVELEAEKALRELRIERIFEEIEKCFREDLPYTTISKFWLTELKKKYTEDSDES